MYKNLREILSGEKSIRLYLEFLQKNNHADLRILKNTKVSIILSQPLSSHVVIDA
jgi:26S proteasome regulatory subunit N2